MLEEDAGQSGWFRVMPRLRVHSEGERVRIGDPIILESLVSGQRVMLDVQSEGLVSVDPSVEVSSAGSFRMNQYRSVADQKMDGQLLAGRACTFFHKECEAYLRYDPAMDAGSKKNSVTMRKSDLGGGSHAIFQVQAEDETRGSPCQWNDRFRLRHWTGRFLSVANVKGGDGSYEVMLVSATASRNDPESTLFMFFPQYPLEGAISHANFLQICHVRTMAQLHAITEEPDSAMEVADAVEFKIVASENAYQTDIFAVRSVDIRLLYDLGTVMSALRPFQDFLKEVDRLADGAPPLSTLPVIQKPAEVATPPPKVVSDAPKSMVSHSHELEKVRDIAPSDVEETEMDKDDPAPDIASPEIPEVPSAPPSPPPGGGGDLMAHRQDINCKTVIKVIADLIRFTTQSDISDPFTREGMPIAQRQMILCELGILRLAVLCAEAPFEKSLYRHDEIDASNLGDAEHDVLDLRNLCFLAMRLVRHILRGQSENKNATVSLVPKLLNLLPCGIGSSDVLTELFTDNDMVDQVPDETIAMFVALIRDKKRHERCKCPPVFLPFGSRFRNTSLMYLILSNPHLHRLLQMSNS